MTVRTVAVELALCGLGSISRAAVAERGVELLAAFRDAAAYPLGSLFELTFLDASSASSKLCGEEKASTRSWATRRLGASVGAITTAAPTVAPAKASTTEAPVTMASLSTPAAMTFVVTVTLDAASGASMDDVATIMTSAVTSGSLAESIARSGALPEGQVPTRLASTAPVAKEKKVWQTKVAEASSSAEKKADSNFTISPFFLAAAAVVAAFLFAVVAAAGCVLVVALTRRRRRRRNVARPEAGGLQVIVEWENEDEGSDSDSAVDFELITGEYIPRERVG